VAAPQYGDAEDLDAAPLQAEAGKDPLAHLSREQWQERVREAKRRAQDIATQIRSQPSPELILPTLEEEQRIASERVLNDVTLERGDIVVTDKGSFVFKGSGTEPRKPADFVPLAEVPIRN
jgi:hypothetical protein